MLAFFGTILLGTAAAEAVPFRDELQIGGALVLALLILAEVCD